MPDNLHLECRECGRAMVLDASAQAAIVKELKLPAQRKLIDCTCGRFQFVLGAEVRKRCAAGASQ
jgi:hypothetical protein